MRGDQFKYRDELDGKQAQICEMLEGMFFSLASDIEALCEPSRETSLAQTSLEQAFMWTKKAIALHGAKG